jgi:hypothetical protein
VNARDQAFSKIYRETFPKPKPLAVDVEIGCVMGDTKHQHHWMVADVYGTISGAEHRETRDTPAEHRCIEDMEIIVNGCDIYDALPEALIEQIESDILERKYE